jgi:hypothetical protein
MRIAEGSQAVKVGLHVLCERGRCPLRKRGRELQ